METGSSETQRVSVKLGVWTPLVNERRVARGGGLRWPGSSGERGMREATGRADLPEVG